MKKACQDSLRDEEFSENTENVLWAELVEQQEAEHAVLTQTMSKRIKGNEKGVTDQEMSMI